MTEPAFDSRTMSTESASDSQSTGDQRVDSAVGRLAELDELDVDKQSQVFDEIHSSLNHVLNEPQLPSHPALRPSPPPAH